MNADHSKQVGGIIFAGLVPHAPILIPEIGQQRLEAVGASIASIKRLAERLVEKRPDGVLVISPHSPSLPGSFGVWSGSRLHGSFEEFGFSEVCVDLPNDVAFAAEVHRQAITVGLRTWAICGSQEPRSWGRNTCSIELR